MSIYAADDELVRVLDVLALSNDPMFAINQRHRIVFWNRGMKRLLGYEYDDVVGRSCSTVLAGDDEYGNRYCSESCPVLSIAGRGEAVRQFRLRAPTKSGEKLLVDVSVLNFMLRVSNSMLLVHVVRPAEERSTSTRTPAIAFTEPERFTDARFRELTAREMEVLGMIASGHSTREIATRLGIAPLTARNHLQRMLEKLEVHSKAEAVALAYRMHVV